MACSENIEKFTPASSQVAPSGYGAPGRVANVDLGILKLTLMASRNVSGNRCDYGVRLEVRFGSRYYRGGRQCDSSIS
ncbi:MAG TPA: hypothetical protein VN936_07090, partial [Candidatus Acidoferrum sp.]|nr:hypothetical protein [Candidatus Acidoferrum sp.]